MHAAPRSIALHRNFESLCPTMGLILLLLAAALCFLAPGALGQTTAAPTGPAKTASQAERPSAGGSHESVKVHGYWKIDVYNPDGTLAKHIEFENKLETGNPNWGPTDLVNLMRGTAVSLGPAIQIHSGNVGPDYMAVHLSGSNSAPVVSYNDVSIGGGPGPCGGNDCLLSPTSSAFYSNCLWVTANLSSAGYNSKTCVGGLSVSGSGYNSTQSPPVLLPVLESLTLTGEFTADTTSLITAVETILNFCRFDEFASGACAAPATPGSLAVAVSLPYYLTAYTIPAQGGSSTPGLSVTAGQAVNVSVTLSFQ
jgi:hypothetical protein